MTCATITTFVVVSAASTLPATLKGRTSSCSTRTSPKMFPDRESVNEALRAVGQVVEMRERRRARSNKGAPPDRGHGAARGKASSLAFWPRRVSAGVMPREMRRWVFVPGALAAGATAIVVVLIMVGGFAVTYNPVQADGSIDNVPARTLGFFLLGAPRALAFASVAYLVAFNLSPPTRVLSSLYFAWALGLAIAVSFLLAISARASFVRWYEVFYLVGAIPLLLAPLQAGFMVGSAVALGITKRSTRRAEAARA